MTSFWVLSIHLSFWQQHCFLFFYFCQYSDIQDIDHVSFSSSKIIVWLLVDKPKLNVIGRLGIIDLEFEGLKVMMLFIQILRYHY
jgi:hypothetical protein